MALTMTVTPALAAAFLSGHRVTERETWAIRTVRRGYAPLLRLAERHALANLTAALALFAGSCLLATRLGGEFLPNSPKGRSS